jgi:hypothetical protein
MKHSEHMLLCFVSTVWNWVGFMHDTFGINTSSVLLVRPWMAQAASRQPLTAEALVRARFSAHGICVGQSGTGISFFPRSSVFLLQYSTVTLHCHISPEGWTIGPLEAAVQRHRLTPSTWTVYSSLHPAYGAFVPHSCLPVAHLNTQRLKYRKR